MGFKKQSRNWRDSVLGCLFTGKAVDLKGCGAVMWCESKTLRQPSRVPRSLTQDQAPEEKNVLDEERLSPCRIPCPSQPHIMGRALHQGTEVKDISHLGCHTPRTCAGTGPQRPRGRQEGRTAKVKTGHVLVGFFVLGFAVVVLPA